MTTVNLNLIPVDETQLVLAASDDTQLVLSAGDETQIVLSSVAISNGLMMTDGSNSALALGSAGTPSLKFAGDANTGIFSPGADQLSVTTGGTERLRVDGAGQIEAVSLGSAAAPTFSFTSDPNTGVYSPGADQLAISTAGTGRLFVDSAGRVLLNQSTAIGSSLLQAARDDGNLNLASLVAFANDAAGAELYIRRGRGSIASPTSLQNGDVVGNINFFAYNGSGSAAVASIGSATDGVISSTSTPGNFYIKTTPSGSTSGVERLRITSTGNVGIGTSSPGLPLDVVGGIRSQSGTIDARLQAGYGGAVGIGAQSNDPVLFIQNATERLRIDSSGRLLGGTSSTSADTRLVLQGTSSNANAGAYIHLQRGTLPASDGTPTGRLIFADNSSNAGAHIESYAEGAWTSGTSHPGRLVFSTTASGAPSPTERIRIKSTGIVNIANTPTYADNAAATAGGLVAGDIYRTSTGQLMIRY